MSALKALKKQLKEENQLSEAWYLRQKADQFEACLRGVESHYTKAEFRLVTLINILSSITLLNKFYGN